MPPQVPHPDPGVPDTRGPLRYIWWLTRSQPWRVLRGAVIGTAWMVGLAVRPYLIARAIDDGLRKHDEAALLWWVAAIVAAGIALAWLGIMRHRTMTFVREDATARSAEVLLRHLSTVGAVLPRRLAAGEVATVTGSDVGRVGAVTGWIDALTMVIPGLFLAAVVWLAARMAAAGDITVGQVVAVYGYVAILIVPVWFLLDGGYEFIRGRVAARRIIALLRITPDEVGGGSSPAPERPADLYDPSTGLTVPDGRLIAVAADDPGAAAALADRLGRFVVSHVTWGGRPLSGVALAEVRARILV